MSNTSKGWGRKGSKFWMQMVACFPNLEEKFISQIASMENVHTDQKDIEWISPRADKGLDEYSLNSNALEQFISFPKEYWKCWNNTNSLEFWTTRQPQWDGIAFCKKSNTLYLIEAKSHISETYTEIAVDTNSQGSKDSFELRMKSLKHARDSYNIKGREEKWWGGKLVKKLSKNEKFYYQIGNRLTFLKFLKEKKESIRVKLDREEYKVDAVKLILLNFADDYTLDDDEEKRPIAATVEEWENHYTNHVWKDVLMTDSAPKDVLVINYSVKESLPDIQFRKDADMQLQKSASSNRMVRVDKKAHNLFFYKPGSVNSANEMDIPFCFKVINGKMHCCERDTDTMIPALENKLGVK